MKEFDLLSQMEGIFKESGYDCSIEPHSKSPPFGRLLVFIGNDIMERERILEVTAQEQDLGESLKSPPVEPQYARIQFEIALPFSVQEQTSNETTSLLAFINRMLEVPGFEFDEINDRVFYRYVLLTPKAGVEKPLIVGLSGVILMLLDMFSPTIERITQGKSTFNEILEEVLHSIEALEK